MASFMKGFEVMGTLKYKTVFRYHPHGKKESQKSVLLDSGYTGYSGILVQKQHRYKISG